MGVVFFWGAGDRGTSIVLIVLFFIPSKKLLSDTNKLFYVSVNVATHKASSHQSLNLPNVSNLWSIVLYCQVEGLIGDCHGVDCRVDALGKIVLIVGGYSNASLKDFRL